MAQLRVGVLMGGRSIEKEVSFNSGRTVCDHLDGSLYEVIPLFQTTAGLLYLLPWHFLPRGKISDFEHRLAREAMEIAWDDLKQRIDFMYIAVHGRYAEDGTLQGFLEVLGIPYLGAKVYASALGMDKITQKEQLSLHRVSVPKGIVVTPVQIRTKGIEQAIAEQLKHAGLAYPLIVKPHKEGSSLGISVVHTHEELVPALRKACIANPVSEQAVLVEEKVEGMEFACIVITDHAKQKLMPLPPTEVVHEAGTEFFSYEQKYMPGRATKFTPARCTPAERELIQNTCMQVMQVLEFSNIARIDGFLTLDGRVVITDPNSLSGLAPSSFIFRQAAEIGMNHAQLINHLIETELASYARRQACTPMMQLGTLQQAELT